MSVKIIVDEGSSHIKAQELGKTDSFFIMPSRVVSGHKASAETSTCISNQAYTINGQELSVSPDAENPQTTANGAEYQTSDTVTVLVHDALRQMGYGGKDVEIIVTLPITLFYARSGINTELIEKKKKQLMTHVENANGLPLANITSVSVRPEGISIAYDAILDDTGAQHEKLADIYKVLVIDIGGTTVDMALLNNKGEVNDKHSNHSAVFKLREEVTQRIADDTSIKAGRVAPFVMDRALQTGKLRQYDISPHIDVVSKHLATEIIKDLYTLVADKSSIDLLVIGGGGAHTIGRHIKSIFGQDIAHVVIPEEPEKSVVRGFNKHHLGS